MNFYFRFQFISVNDSCVYDKYEVGVSSPFLPGLQTLFIRKRQAWGVNQHSLKWQAPGLQGPPRLRHSRDEMGNFEKLKPREQTFIEGGKKREKRSQSFKSSSFIKKKNHFF